MDFNLGESSSKLRDLAAVILSFFTYRIETTISLSVLPRELYVRRSTGPGTSTLSLYACINAQRYDIEPFVVGGVTHCAQKPRETSTEKYVVKPSFQLVQKAVFLKLHEASKLPSLFWRKTAPVIHHRLQCQPGGLRDTPGVSGPSQVLRSS